MINNFFSDGKSGRLIFEFYEYIANLNEKELTEKDYENMKKFTDSIKKFTEVNK